MTNREALISLVGFPPNKAALERCSVDHSFDPAGTYTLGTKDQLKKAAIDLLNALISTPTTWNENGYKIEYDKDAILALIGTYEDDLGIVRSRPTIKGIRPW